MSEDFLEYEDEMVLSDALVSRRQVLDRIEENDQIYPDDATEDDIRLVEEGDQAAKELVAYYFPKIRTLAWSVLRRKTSGFSSGSNEVELEDLFNVGYEAALKCTNRFNARGKGILNEEGVSEHRRGLRFASYAGNHILREMNRYIDKSSTPFRVNVDALSRTWVVKGVQAEIRDNKRRTPTEEELESKTGISIDYVREYMTMPSRSGMVDVDDVDVAQRVIPVSEAVASALDSEQNAYDLERVLIEGARIPRQAVDILFSLMGVDNGLPRTTSEMGKHLGYTRMKGYWERWAYDYLKHPMSRVRIAEMIRQIKEERGEAS